MRMIKMLEQDQKAFYVALARQGSDIAKLWLWVHQLEQKMRDPLTHDKGKPFFWGDVDKSTPAPEHSCAKDGHRWRKREKDDEDWSFFRCQHCGREAEAPDSFLGDYLARIQDEMKP